MLDAHLFPLTSPSPVAARSRPTLAAYDMDELKLIYRVLHGEMLEHVELMDSVLFSELQTHLQSAAQRDGVDVTHHSAWDAWLGKSATFAS